MEADEVTRFLTTELGATVNLQRITEISSETESNYSSEAEITATAVKSIMRKVKPTTAIPRWSIPTASWILAEDNTSEPLARIWNDIARNDNMPSQWEEMQTIWLDKAGKDATNIGN